MDVLLSKSEIKGRVRAPSSKSYTLRALMCAALAKGESEIINPLTSDDTEAASNVLMEIGVDIRKDEGSWRVKGGNFRGAKRELFCKESATTLRFMTAICSLIPEDCTLIAGPSLSRRPVGLLVEALRQLGVDCSCRDGVVPVVVKGGRLKGGTAELPGDISSQFISALLLVSPFAEEGVRIRLTTPLESKPYVMMTMECMSKFGIIIKSSPDLREFEIARQEYRPSKYGVEGDWSSASYLLALGAVAGEIKVENLNLRSRQGDIVIMDFLKDMGASAEIEEDSVKVRKSRLKAIKADLSDSIDLLPTMAVLAATAEGVSEFVGIDRARQKESDRVQAVKEGLERMNIGVITEKDRLTIAGSTPKGSIIDTYDDHRIAMAFSILGVLAGGTKVRNAECVSKTFPQFWDVLKNMGAEVKVDGK